MMDVKTDHSSVTMHPSASPKSCTRRVATSPVLAVIVVVVVICLMPGATQAQYNYNQFFGASNYFGVGMNSNQGYWYAQTQCPWGSTGYRTSSSFQCGSFTCPSMWFGTSTYNCPMGTIFSNSLQMCVNPAVLANNCRRRVG